MKVFPPSQSVDDAILTRRSVRAFLPKPVDRQTVEDILALAARAPSGSNIQPWQVTVLFGEARAELSRRILAVHNDPALLAQHAEPYAYYPRRWVSPYIERRRTLGWALYGLLGIGRDDKARMHAQMGRNFEFFGAPVGLIFTIDKVLEQGSWLDYGMFLENIMLAARARGLDTCPQAAFNHFHRVIAEFLELDQDKTTIVCGMALGYADPAAVENSLETEREAPSGFARFVE